MTPNTLVLGAGIVGRAAVWDLLSRGHQVTVADTDIGAAAAVGTEFGTRHVAADAGNGPTIAELFAAHDAVIAAVPYHYGIQLAATAIETRCHYFDFGGNPTIVAKQLERTGAAASAGVAVVPDCGLAPGLANVMAAGLVAQAEPNRVDSVQIRVGCLPQQPTGALHYDLAFHPDGLINEYDEPCEILEAGEPAVVQPLTRFEEVSWDKWGPLEAFATAGGASTMCRDFAGRINQLEYKTLRYPGHGQVFRSMRELGLFATETRTVGQAELAPRALLLDLLAENLPQGGPDVVLVRVELTSAGESVRVEFEDVHDGTFSALARTTAFPATAFCDLVTRGTVPFAGVASMVAAAPPDLLLEELEAVGIVATRR